MHAHDLGRPGSCDAQPLRAPEHYESGSLRIATRLLTLRLSQGFSLRRCIKVEGRPLGPRGASENLCGLAAVVVSANAGASRRIVSRCVFRHPDAITRQCTTVLTLR
jgi:hypothetical protein